METILIPRLPPSSAFQVYDNEPGGVLQSMKVDKFPIPSVFTFHWKGQEILSLMERVHPVCMKHCEPGGDPKHNVIFPGLHFPPSWISLSHPVCNSPVGLRGCRRQLYGSHHRGHSSIFQDLVLYPTQRSLRQLPEHDEHPEQEL